MRVYVLFLVLFVVSDSSAEAQESAPFCDSRQLPVVYSGDSARIVHEDFVSGRYSAGQLRVQLLVSKPVINLSAVVEYRDEREETLLTLVYQTATEEGSVLPSHLDRAYHARKLPFPIKPSERVLLTGSSPTTSRHCPEDAKITALEMIFNDRSTLLWSAPEWKLDARLLGIPGDVRLPPAAIPEGKKIQIEIEVDSEGRVTKTLPMVSTPKERLLPLLSTIERWVFAPALIGGRARNCRMVLLIRFREIEDRKGGAWEYLIEDGVSSPFTVVDFFPMQDLVGVWEILYGNWPVPTRGHTD